MMIHPKIAYIGGGSKMWARIFMNDLALDDAMCGEISLYDIDIEAAKRNEILGQMIYRHPHTVSKWEYSVATKIEDCLHGATFVVLSILPGTFTEMQSDVHEPEAFGIYQTVGDTVGPGGVLRSLRTVPLYEYFAKKIQEICPDAWVINLTNPMSICVKTLYDVFPEIKAFGCCHEVFHAQEFLGMVVEESLGLQFRPSRKQIEIDVAGINHFTWISEAFYVNENGEKMDVFPLIPTFIEHHFQEGIYEGLHKDQFRYDTYAYGNKVKMDLFRKYGILAAAGDRHLAEFFNNRWYLESPETIHEWAMAITPVSSRIESMNKKIQLTLDIISGKEELRITKSSEEAVAMMKAVLGLGDLRTNVNFPNQGQMSDFPRGTIVETNCLFSKDRLTPVKAKSLGTSVNNLCLRNALNIDSLYEGIKKRNFQEIYAAFINQPLCSVLSDKEGKTLFTRMVMNTRKYVAPYFDLDKLAQLQ